jgi:hypothetical protein
LPIVREQYWFPGMESKADADPYAPSIAFSGFRSLPTWMAAG